MKKFLAVVAVLALATAASQAAVLVKTVQMDPAVAGTSAQLKVYSLGSVTVFGVSYDVLRVDAVKTGTGNDLITAVDLKVTPEAGQWLLQVRAYSEEDFGLVNTPTMAAAGGGWLTASSAGFDTHFSPAAYGAAETTPAETYTAALGYIGEERVMKGGVLSGTMNVGLALRQENLPLFQVVIPTGKKAYMESLSKEKWIADGVGNAFGLSAPLELTAVPEPATMALLAIGAMGLISRRRRS